MIVSIDRMLTWPDASSAHAVRRMKAVLQRQGQIEPLQVRAHGDKFIPFAADAWGNEIIHAARELGWKDILIVVIEKYEA